MHHSRPLLMGSALLLAAHAAGAQTIYRCGNSYGTQPCAGGTIVEGQPNASPEEAARARRGAEADAKRADELQKARLAQEQAAPKAVVMGPAQKPSEVKPPKKAGKDGKPGKPPGDFTAMGPKPAKPAK
ncbi:hypothetical protein [Ramlibacter pallidus]|uniref:DUF4124 domain-containing protein n=1 Tax=Ramlibacter pallidus TaxID=2780087 RepID=A0ABR9RZ73_9BURK|nr:hypothetical protein [Ramlibacter pallidus]MBE7366561.1 hypothetical protein [Ramlibacter pallidus]